MRGMTKSLSKRISWFSRMSLSSAPQLQTGIIVTSLS